MGVIRSRCSLSSGGERKEWSFGAHKLPYCIMHIMELMTAVPRVLRKRKGKKEKEKGKVAEGMAAS